MIEKSRSVATRKGLRRFLLDNSEEIDQSYKCRSEHVRPLTRPVADGLGPESVSFPPQVWLSAGTVQTVLGILSTNKRKRAGLRDVGVCDKNE